ncbi:hypothetical protein MCG98_06380 [Ruminococcus sp. OA3]|uniref:hypothetical protein n=1 Tax=Ruminococcus sp. OA3 TaxID=2914164 RepID=UPI001F05E55C|nr:hypothetical protein [Ruminococcus sp. OA3]MCH1982191.1 hypothetical protein [Ruminococcus sp. OA3]
MKKIIYTKYSNERSAPYAIRTDIVKDETGMRTVRKTPCYPDGRQHIGNISRFYTALSRQYENTPIRMNACRVCDDGVELDYLEGVTLEEQIDTLIAGQNYDGAREQLMSYLHTVKNCGEQSEFQMTEEFCRVFGNISLPRGLKSLAVTDIDMVLANVLVSEGWNLIDYEWTFEFPVPLSFVLFRIIHYYTQTSDKRSCVREWNLSREMGITEEETAQYLQMEKHFQDYIQGNHVPVREMYDDISPGVLSVYQLAEREHKKKRDEQLQVFYSDGGEFSEGQSLYYPMPQGRIRICLTFPGHIKKIRLDPCSYAGVLTISQLEYIGGDQKKCSFITNGFELDEQQVIFDTMDPQILIMEIPDGATALMVDFIMDTATQEIAGFLHRMQEVPKRQKEEIARLSEELMQRERLISEMEHTKVWRAYRKLKKMTGKDK